MKSCNFTQTYPLLERNFYPKKFEKFSVYQWAHFCRCFFYGPCDRKRYFFIFLTATWLIRPVVIYLSQMHVIGQASLREAFHSKKQRKLGIRHLGGGRGVVKKSKKSQVSVGNSSKLGGVSSEIKKVPSSRGYQRLKNNDSFSSYEEPQT